MCKPLRARDVLRLNDGIQRQLLIPFPLWSSRAGGRQRLQWLAAVAIFPTRVSLFPRKLHHLAKTPKNALLLVDTTDHRYAFSKKNVEIN